MTDEIFKNTDRMQSALAMTHHIQTRIAQCIAKGSVPSGIADEVEAMAREVGDTFQRAAKKDQPND